MVGPREMLRRAAENRRRPGRAPAEERVPRPVMVQSSHANYTELMHSHDRLRTRHLTVQGGARRA